jgi:hypothetical protein
MVRATRTIRIVVGVAIWALASGSAWWCLAGRGPDSVLQPAIAADLWRFATGSRRVARLDFDTRCDVRVGDPIFVADGPASVRQIGEVAGVSVEGRGAKATAVFYSSAPPVTRSSKLTYHQTPNSMEWVLRTMLPKEKRSQISAELREAAAQHRVEVVGLLRPVVEDALRDAFMVVEEDLPAALAGRREDLGQLGAKYQREIVDAELLPLLRKQVWPVIREHAEPTVNEVGREIWERASLWRFGWRYAYDKTPLPKRQLTQKEWERFLKEEATPVLEEHTADFLQVQQRILLDLARDPEVRATVRNSLGKIITDPEAQRIFSEVVHEVVLGNPRLKAVLEEHWHSERMQQAIRISSERFEPTVVRIGELLFGTPEGGVTPEFARVLRNQILFKDRRWFVLEPGAGVGDEADASAQLVLSVTPGSTDAMNPFVR